MHGAKEMKEEMMYHEADDRAEETVRLIQEQREAKGRHCSKCGTNWIRLSFLDEEGDEWYETCPKCKTDAHLQDAQPGPWFMFCQFTGRRINVDTGKPEDFPVPPPPPPVAPYREGFDPDKYFAQQEERDLLADKQIDSYMKTLDTEGEAAARKAFHQIKSL